MAVFTLPKEFDPSWPGPGVKPTGQQKIDFANNLSSGLIHDVRLIESYTHDGARGNNLTLSNVALKSIDGGKVLDFSLGDYYGSAVGHQLQEFTHECLICVADFNSPISIIAESPSASSRDRSLYINSTGYVSCHVYDGSTKLISDTTQTQAGEILHLAFTVSAANTIMRLYVNGVEVNNITVSGAYSGLTTPELILGLGDGNDATTYGTSKIFFHRIYERVKTAAEIKSLADNSYQIYKPVNESVYFIPDAGGADHDLLADDVESSSEVSSPTITQEHTLNATDVQSTSEVSSPTITQKHILTADDVQSTSEVSNPTLAQEHTLNATDVQSLSEVSNPVLTENLADHNLFANDVESVSEVSSPILAQIHSLLADNVQSLSEVSSPIITQLHVLAANDIESASEVSNPVLFSSELFEDATFTWALKKNEIVLSSRRNLTI